MIKAETTRLSTDLLELQAEKHNTKQHNAGFSEEKKRRYDRAYDTIRYDTRCYFNVRSNADISQLNIPYGTGSKETTTPFIKKHAWFGTYVKGRLYRLSDKSAKTYVGRVG